MNQSLQVQMQSEINRLSAEVSSCKDACQLEVKTKTEMAPAILIMLHLCVISSLGQDNGEVSFLCSHQWHLICIPDHGGLAVLQLNMKALSLQIKAMSAFPS